MPRIVLAEMIDMVINSEEIIFCFLNDELDLFIIFWNLIKWSLKE